MKTLLLISLLAFSPLLCGQSASPISVVGDFSDMRHTEEHSYGYSLQLWRQGDTLFGFFLASEGLSGDTPTGMLDEVKFDPRSGALSFKAKLNIGVVLLDAGKQAPSRDLFEFRGTLGQDAIAGTLTRRDMLHPGAKPRVSRVQLRKGDSELMTKAATYDDWKKSADEILKRRGPKW
jgi:hypothetical protein